jgi:outer membrane murein-binding lipoprotein Lpp
VIKEVVLMPLRRKYVDILSGVLPAGGLGAALLLGATGPGAADQPPTESQPLASRQDRVSERLAAIREAASAVAGQKIGAEKLEDGNQKLAWGNWWHNWGWYRPWGWGWPNWNNWRNWNNWHNWWRNW